MTGIDSYGRSRHAGMLISPFSDIIAIWQLILSMNPMSNSVTSPVWRPSSKVSGTLTGSSSSSTCSVVNTASLI